VGLKDTDGDLGLEDSALIVLSFQVGLSKREWPLHWGLGMAWRSGACPLASSRSEL